MPLSTPVPEKLTLSRLCVTKPNHSRYTSLSQESSPCRQPFSHLLGKPAHTEHPPRGGRFSFGAIRALRTGLIAAILSTNALAQPDPSGIDFVTIGAPGNPAYAGPDNNNLVTGRGSVPYEFRIGRTEVTTAQWVEFYNAFYGRVPSINLPARWGAYQTGNPQSPFGVVSAPGADMWPVSGVTWRTSAMFCNWLHNDKRTDLSAIQDGAYDISTFGYTGTNGNIFTDQREHHPGARYWIPTVDEWLKGVYYDPNHGGTGIGGWWWNSVNGSNTPLIYGPPGQGQANAGFQPEDNSHYRIPLMAYTGVKSPWGMMDAAGGTSEWLESVYQPTAVPYRFVAGSHWGSTWRIGDPIYSLGATFPSDVSLNFGFRIAAAVPSSGPFAVMMLVGARFLVRRGRAPGVSHETGSVARGPGGPGWRRRFGER